MPDDFFVVRELGRGGLGVVTLAQRTSETQQYAVKSTLVPDEAARSMLTAELQLWIDLPAHPNLARCFFSRMVGDRLFVFAEYVDGGSLRDWIDQGLLYAGSRDATLQRILDVATQFAWGLHGIHTLGLVHQDVKPANVLITGRGVVKVTDFGVAAGRPGPDGSGGSLALATIKGGTPAYFSPEQARIAAALASNPEGLPTARLTQRTDIWSWAVSVFEMFVGGPPCPRGGQSARAVFERYVADGGTDARLPTMPASLVALLRKCLEEDEQQRVRSLAHAVEQLKALYRQLGGGNYLRPLVPWLAPADRPDAKVALERTWPDPEHWLEKCRRRGWSVPERAGPAPASWKGQVVADIQAFNQLEPLLRRLAEDEDECWQDCAEILLAKAAAYRRVNDLAMALRSYDRAQAICRDRPRDTSASCLYAILRGKAALLARRGEHRHALDVLQESNRLGGNAGTRTSSPSVDFLGCRVAIGELLPPDDAIAHLHDTVKMYGTLPASREARDGRAGALLLLARKAHELGRADAVVGPLELATGLYTTLVEEGHPQSRLGLALALQMQGLVLYEAGDVGAALALIHRASLLLERLVLEEADTESSGALASAWRLKAMALVRLNAPDEAMRLRERLLAFLEGCVVEDGRNELEFELATAHLDQANTLDGCDDLMAALRHYERAGSVFHRLYRSGTGDTLKHVAVVHILRSRALRRLGRPDESKMDARVAHEMLVERLARENREDLRALLADVETLLRG